MLSKETLNYAAPSIVAVVLVRETPEEAEATYREIAAKLIDEYYPVLTGWLTRQQIDKKAHECKTMEELEALRYDMIPDTFFSDLSDMINKEEKLLNDQERLFVLVQLSERIVFSAKQYCNQIMLQRAEVLLNSKPKIIL